MPVKLLTVYYNNFKGLSKGLSLIYRLLYIPRLMNNFTQINWYVILN